MFADNEEVARVVAALAATAATELFEAYGVRLRPAGSRLETDESVVSGIMGVGGRELRGTCMLAATAGVIAASCPTRVDLRDWTGELTNQLVGRLKGKLVTRGLEVWMTTPIVLTAARIEPSPRGTVDPTAFNADEGSLLVWVETETTPNFTLPDEQSELSAMTEGSLYLF